MFGTYMMWDSSKRTPMGVWPPHEGVNLIFFVLWIDSAVFSLKAHHVISFRHSAWLTNGWANYCLISIQNDLHGDNASIHYNSIKYSTLSGIALCLGRACSQFVKRTNCAPQEHFARHKDSHGFIDQTKIDALMVKVPLCAAWKHMSCPSEYCNHWIDPQTQSCCEEHTNVVAGVCE